APLDHKFKVYTSGQKRRVTPQIKRDFKRRAAIEPVIGHLKEHHRMGRNYLAHASGDAINAVLAAAGYNFRRLLAWLRLLLLRILIAFSLSPQLKPVGNRVLHGRLISPHNQPTPAPLPGLPIPPICDTIATACVRQADATPL